MRIVATAFAVLLLAGGCRTRHTSSASGAMEASPSPAHFEPTYAGGTRELTLTLRNAAPFSRQVTLAVDAPFSVAQSTLELPGGASATTTLRFSPASAVHATGTLALSSDDDRLVVPLDGVGLAAPACPPPAACRSVSFDPDSGKCVDSAGPDGVACSTACISAGSCAAGACAGQPVDCDDHDPCTVDTCDDVTGCGHPPVQCSQPSDPCHAAVCSGAAGCTIVEVTDGTSCGASDCGESHVCLAGSCELRPTPDGSPCGTATPCQARGVCQGQQCVQPAATALQPVWTVATTAQAYFPGVADAQGNLFWFEDSELVSVDRDGAFRFRVALAHAPPPPDYDDPNSPLILASPQVLIALTGKWTPLGDSTLEARSTVDGSKLWSHTFTDLSELLHASDSEEGFAFMALAAQPPTGNFVATARANAGGAAWDNWVLGLDVTTGSLQWKARFDYLSGLIVDSAGAVYTYNNLWTHDLIALDPMGGTRWSLAISEPPALTFGQTLLSGYSANLREVNTGAVAVPFSPAIIYVDPLNDPTPVATPSWLIIPDSNLFCSRGLASFDPTTGANQWSAMFNCMSDPILTAADSLLVRDLATSQTLTELAHDGSTTFSCALAQTSNPFSGTHAALLPGRLVLPTTNGVSAYDLPGLELAHSGWPCAGGGLGRGSTPQ